MSNKYFLLMLVTGLVISAVSLAMGIYIGSRKESAEIDETIDDSNSTSPNS